MARPSKREDVLEAADHCFYEHGIAATGVDAIAEAAGVSKRTLYNHFPSKDDLLEHYLSWREERWRRRLDEALDGVEDPVDRILVYFDVYFASLEGDAFRGCAFINAAAELPDDSPGLAVIVASKERVRADVAALLAEAGHPDPGPTSLAVATLLEGGCAVGGIRRSADQLPALKDAARALATAALPVA
ncbi:TetR/AcrR family transcriptional regulator [Iamia majanohamensis]|uniref:TetR/AcrR family transcriptional regulator n=1 Tax=Iamia majanohamensis TaxID=467976 RepID=A0AAE9Y6K8_9ACTN|nr:TetR/AcrR family transcriptional regulator [Iamia majanohamensis]WCO67635.1 TetR/AcrR family transcriptional regulator [Iamia majanohamensis]